MNWALLKRSHPGVFGTFDYKSTLGKKKFCVFWLHITHNHTFHRKSMQNCLRKTTFLMQSSNVLLLDFWEVFLLRIYCYISKTIFLIKKTQLQRTTLIQAPKAMSKKLRQQKIPSSKEGGFFETMKFIYLLEIVTS